MVGIYKITNTVTGLSYIGQSRDIMKRFEEHYHHRNQINANPIDQFMKDFPIEFFNFQILELCDPIDLDWKEEYWIRHFETNKYGYNIVDGGSQNFGEGNPNVKLTSEDVYNIRELYNQHKNPNEVYKNNYFGKISLTSFFRIWEGGTWPHIHMDVYTPENREFYRNIPKSNNKQRTNFTDNEVLEFRKRYMNEFAEEIYNSLNLDCCLSTFKGILQGDSYKHLPYYSKKEKRWIG